MTTEFNSSAPTTGSTQNRAPVPAPPGRSASSGVWVMAGGAAVFFGSLLPFVTFSLYGLFSEDSIGAGPRTLSALFGLAILGLGAAIRFGPPAVLRGVSAAAFCCAALGALGYAGFILLGLHGISEEGSLGIPARITYSPNIGIILALAGCVAAAVSTLSAIRALLQRTS